MRISKEILNLKPYGISKTVDQVKREYGLKHVVKLANNECPLGPSPAVIEAINQAAKSLNCYPDPSYYELVQRLAAFYKVSEKQIAVGNGSSELIDLVIRLFCEHGDEILTWERSFVAYKKSASISRVRVHELPLAADLRMNVQAAIDYLENQRHPRARVLFLPNPNNPTGTYINVNELKGLLDAVKKIPDMILVLDEAYFEFARASDFPNGLNFLHVENLLVMRTFSKAFCLAGLRLGTLIGSPDLIELIHRVRSPFNINALVPAAAIAAMDDKEHLKRCREITWRGLEQLESGLKALGVKVTFSQANFLLLEAGCDAEGLTSELLKRGIIVRALGEYGFNQHLRVSVGLPDENDLFLKALEECLSQLGAA